MPELPEVETIVRGLRRGSNPLPGQRIKKVTILWPRHIGEPSIGTFRRRIRDRVIRDAQRRGKYLVFPLDLGTLLIHLKMTGDLRLTESDSPPGRFEHTIFHLANGWDLRFSDARKFGRVYLLDEPKTILGKLGPEPLDPSFTPEVFIDRLSKHKRMLKPLLLDQTFIAGLGNIYVDEALHLAKLHPRRLSSSLDKEESLILWQGIQEALKSGLKHKGASLDWVFRDGEYQDHFLVYKRTGKPCKVCSTAIFRELVGQRSTHYCPNCQPEVLD